MTDVINISTEEETRQLATKFAKTLKMGDIVLLYGTLGVGKTFFTRSIIQTLLNSNTPVPSPTFTIVQNYDTPAGTISHYDLYRIEDASELFELDIDNSLKNNITIIEWPEIIEDYITENFNPIKIKILNYKDLIYIFGDLYGI